MKKVKIKNFSIGKNEPLVFISGPCVIESRDDALYAAEQLKIIFSESPFPFIYKSSYDKANRLSIDSFRGPGIDKGLKILEEIKNELDIPILTDVHSPEEAKTAAEVADMIQIPAFLCRQTDLLVAAGKTKAAVNIKKGQFLAPQNMKSIVEKVLSTGNERIILTDRGTCFGYNNLVSDMRAIPIMQSFGFPVCFDASHSTQLPGYQGKQSGGQNEFIPLLAKSAVAAGCNCLFIESHKKPSVAKSDSNAMISFENLKELLKEIERLYYALNIKEEVSI